MTSNDLLQKTCLIGISYFSSSGELLKQTQLAGTVVAVEQKDGISIQLMPNTNDSGDKMGKKAIFMLPTDLTAWFTAPSGVYKHADTGIDITDPNYLVTWDVHQSKKDTPEGQHEWWQWTPRTVPPRVGA